MKDEVSTLDQAKIWAIAILTAINALGEDTPWDTYARKQVASDLDGLRYCYTDLLIRGVQGEFYPCKPDIFDATYEAVDG